MKSIKTLAAGLLAASVSSTAFANADFVITGATAFRSAASEAIIQALGGHGTVSVGYIGAQGWQGSDRQIFSVPVASAPDSSLDTDSDGFVIVKTSWSGSTGGIADVAGANPVQVLVDGSPASADTTVGGAGGTQITTPSYTTQVARFTFSDVTQASSTTTSPVLQGGGVGVIPFQFVATEGSNAAGITTMTPQLFRALYGPQVGSVPLSFISGDPTDTATVYGIGRNSSSGTRATMLAETGFGVFNSVTQYDFWIDDQTTGQDGDPATNELEIDLANLGRPQDVSTSGFFFGTGGYSSSSYVRTLIKGDVPETTPGTPDFYVIGYIDAKDVADVLANGGDSLEYAGADFSADAVKEGSYTLWGYEQFLYPAGLSTAENNFRVDIETGVDAALVEPNFIKNTNMNVVRPSDGGTVTQ